MTPAAKPSRNGRIDSAALGPIRNTGIAPSPVASAVPVPASMRTSIAGIIS